jgi:hypothetical protein
MVLLGFASCLKTKNPLGLLRQRVMRILVLANRYAHLIKRGAKPW